MNTLNANNICRNPTLATKLLRYSIQKIEQMNPCSHYSYCISDDRTQTCIRFYFIIAACNY